MAQVQAAIGLDSLAGIDARNQAFARLESLAEDVDAALARRKSNGLLRRAIKAWKRGDISLTARHALAATEADGSNAKGFHVLAMALDRMGHMHKALVTYERAFELDPEDPELLINLGLIAWRLKISSGAEKMFRHYIDAMPDSPLGYNNLGSIQSDMGEVGTALETLRAAIYRMPKESILWNSLATVLAEDGRVEESLIFYEEAIKLDPEFARLHHNLGYAFSHLGRLHEALTSYDLALEHVTDPMERMETQHSRSICLIGKGEIDEGFREYEIRNHPRFRAHVHHVLKAPRWQGEPISGKRLLIVGEQGLGDEFMFANILPDVTRDLGPNGQLDIAVDKRLIPLFQRSFPRAHIGTYDDRTLIDREGNKALRFVPFAVQNGEPDFWASMGSALQHYRKRLEDFPREAFLIADPERAAIYRGALKKSPMTVGICWRSMMLTAKRAKYYSPLATWEPLLRMPGVSFVNLQYGDCARELDEVRHQLGVEIQEIDGLDLKDDIDGAAALASTLDLVISAPTAAAAMAASIGTPVWFLTAGRTWPQLGTDEFPWYRQTRVFSPEKFGDWSALMPKVAGSLATLVAERRA